MKRRRTRFSKPMKDDAFSEYADEPAAAKDKPITEGGSPEGQGDSIHIPSEFLQGNAGKFKEGDELVLKVVSADDEGIEVEYAKEPGGEGEGGDEGGMNANDEIDQAQSKSMAGAY